MTRYLKPSFPAHDDAWDNHNEPPSLSNPTDKLLTDNSTSFLDHEASPGESPHPTERRRCCTRLTIDWNAIVVSLLAYTIIFLLTLALSLAHFFVGARILKYSTASLQYSYTYTKHYLGGTTVINHGVGVTGAFMRSIAAGSAIMALLLCTCAGFALVLLSLARCVGEVTPRAVFWVVTLGSTVAAAVVAGVGVWLRPVDDFSHVHAFNAGGVGLAVLVVPLTLFFALVRAIAGFE